MSRDKNVNKGNWRDIDLNSKLSYQHILFMMISHYLEFILINIRKAKIKKMLHEKLTVEKRSLNDLKIRYVECE